MKICRVFQQRSRCLHRTAFVSQLRQHTNAESPMMISLSKDSKAEYKTFMQSMERKGEEPSSALDPFRATQHSHMRGSMYNLTRDIAILEARQRQRHRLHPMGNQVALK